MLRRARSPPLWAHPELESQPLWDSSRASTTPLRAASSWMELTSTACSWTPTDAKSEWCHRMRYCSAEAFGKTSLSRSEEHTSELQSQSNLVCRLLLEKKKKQHTTILSSLSS